MTAPDVHALLCEVGTLLRGFDEGVFLRATHGDLDPAWAIKMLPYLRAMAKLKVAVDAQAALAHAPATPADKTCATCQWWSENKNPQGVSLGDGRCFKGVRVGNPTRQSVDGGLYTHAAFGCLLHEPAPVASVRGEVGQ